MTRELTEADKRAGFIRCTGSMGGFEEGAKRWAERTAKGMTDEELAEALEYEIGIEGGGTGYGDCPGYHYRGAGLQIWLKWGFPRTYEEKPTFKGAATIAMARTVYGIRHPDDKQ